MSTVVRAGPEQSQEPRVPSRSSIGVQGPRGFSLLLLLSQGHYLGLGSEMNQSGLHLAPIWDSGVSGSSCTCCTTVLAPQIHFKKVLLWRTELLYLAIEQSSATYSGHGIRKHFTKGTNTITVSPGPFQTVALLYKQKAMFKSTITLVCFFCPSQFLALLLLLDSPRMPYPSGHWTPWLISFATRTKDWICPLGATFSFASSHPVRDLGRWQAASSRSSCIVDTAPPPTQLLKMQSSYERT